MSQQVALLIGGLGVGSIYALVALGFVIIFKSSNTLNFAHVAVMLLGAYLVLQGTRSWHLSFWPAVLVSALLCAVVSGILYLLVAAPLVGRSIFAIAIATIGAETALRSGIGSYTPWAGDNIEVGSPWGAKTVGIFGARIFTSQLWLIATAVVVVTVLIVSLQRSRWGILFRAIADDEEAAAANGVNVKIVLVGAWAVAGLLAAVAGAFTGVFPRLIFPSTPEIALRSLPAVVIGGMDSVGGAVIGGSIIGLVEVYAARYAPSGLGGNFHLVAAYIVMSIVLLMRPEGLFGKAEVRRV